MNVTIRANYSSEGIPGKLLIESITVETHYTEQHYRDWKPAERLENFARVRFAIEALNQESDRIKRLLMEDMTEAELEKLIGKKYTSEYGSVTLGGVKGKDMAVSDMTKLRTAIGETNFMAAVSVGKTKLTEAVGKPTYAALVKNGIIVDGTTVKTLKYGKPEVIGKLVPAGE